jgi:peptidoglycan hydrolase-like protein with peptidoglycan-binding domain
MRPFRRTPSLSRTLGSAAVTLALAASTAVAVSAPAAADGRATPGDFTGYGFDQCVAPTQAKMDRWLTHSPYFAVGIYISGNSRACRDQPNLTPAWVDRQLRTGWRLLPITLGPQSTCVGRYPRYGPKIDPTIVNSSANDHAAARGQGAREANVAVYRARQLGIAAGSTLWYDLEGWSDYRNATCRESALAFLSAWTTQLHRWGYVSGTYSSAGSGMKILDDARYQRRRDVVLPDRIWIARWDGRANTSTSYIREDGWRPGNRMKQYRGGHNETHGGVTINIDNNYLDLGRGSRATPVGRACGLLVDLPAYWPVGPGTTNTQMVQVLQCFLRVFRVYAGPVDGRWSAQVRQGVNAWQRTYGMPVRTFWARNDWIALLSHGGGPVLKVGSTGNAVRRLQRALNAAGHRLAPDAVVNVNDSLAVRAYQRRLGLAQTGVVDGTTWSALRRGRY